MIRASLAMYFFVIFLQLSVVFNGIKCNPRVDPLVQTSAGLVKGIKEEHYSKFLGIPYAQIDKDNPFGVSLPHPLFENTFEANDGSSQCPQPYESGTLDCLRLNVYVPDTAHSKNLLPVLFSIHGGAFVSGSGGVEEFGPSFLIRHDIILVTINYRLGVYGFMCLDDPRVAGNQGLKDQIVALRWVKENIKAFGGDESKITVAGESAGSVSIDFHLLYNKDNIFTQAILQSGTSLCPWAVTVPNYNAPFEIAAYMGFELTNTTDDALGNSFEYLAKQNPDDIIKAVIDLDLGFFPCIEQEFDDVEPLYTNTVKNSEPSIKDKTVLIGSNDDESLYIFAFQDIEKRDSIFEYRLKEFYGLQGDFLTSTEEIVRHFYIGDAKQNRDVLSDVTNFDSDFEFLYAIERSIEKMKRYGTNVFRYVFSYDGDRNILKKQMNITFGGASHADELGYLFDSSYFSEKPNEADQVMIDRITTLWANFVKYGAPTTDQSLELIPVDWPPVAENTMPYLDLNTELIVKNRPFEKRMAFWDLLYTYLGLEKENTDVARQL